MSQIAKQTLEMPNDVYESMLKIFIKMALEKKVEVKILTRFLTTIKVEIP